MLRQLYVSIRIIVNLHAVFIWLTPVPSPTATVIYDLGEKYKRKDFLVANTGIDVRKKKMLRGAIAKVQVNMRQGICKLRRKVKEL